MFEAFPPCCPEAGGPDTCNRNASACRLALVSPHSFAAAEVHAQRSNENTLAGGGMRKTLDARRRKGVGAMWHTDACAPHWQP